METGQSLRVSRDRFGQKFKGDETMESGVFGLVHHAHPAATDFSMIR